ncbi:MULTISPECIES: DapH/DapD/GlmU-related protein [unclassified Ruegeria]|uniref:acyltransferase n=1 Tax=unclassified Ruegeria TaxID=2625375 RepID=UPI001489565B|nr:MULTISPECIES: DapH/DapD/GlmU-related protein [unclassified Ruegeria]
MSLSFHHRGIRRAMLLVAIFVSAIPLNALRLGLFRRVFGYKIGKNCKIGMFTVILCRSFTLGDGSTIRARNSFKGDFDFRAGPKFFAGIGNTFICPWVLRDEMEYTASIAFGKDCLVNESHYIDVHGQILVGDGTWLAGRASQFYTHGIGTMDRNISIGNRCFIGSAVRFAPGTRVGNRNIIGIGSVLLNEIDEDEKLISGSPARVIRSIKADLENGRYRFSKSDWT